MYLRPMYGADLRECLQIMRSGNSNSQKAKKQAYMYESSLDKFLNITSHMIYDEEGTPDLLDILNRFVLYIPPVVYATKRVVDLGENAFIRMRVPHPNWEGLNQRRLLVEEINQVAKVYVVLLNQFLR